MKILDKIFHRTTTVNNSTNGNDDIDERKWWTVPYQKDVLETLTEVIPTLMAGSPVVGVDYPLNSVDMSDPMGPNSILCGIGKVTVSMNQTLGITNLKNVSKSWAAVPRGKLQFCSKLLKKYADGVKPEVNQNILSAATEIDRYLEN